MRTKCGWNIHLENTPTCIPSVNETTHELSMAIFHSYITHDQNQRVYPIKSHETTMFLWFSHGFPHVAWRNVARSLRLHEGRHHGVRARHCGPIFRWFVDVFLPMNNGDYKYICITTIISLYIDT